MPAEVDTGSMALALGARPVVNGADVLLAGAKESEGDKAVGPLKAEVLLVLSKAEFISDPDTPERSQSDGI